jgi:hypothetical protein
MDPNPAHSLTIIDQAGLDIYAIQIQLAAVQIPGTNTFNRAIVSNLIQTNANWVAIPYNQPVQLNTATYITVICIKPAGEPIGMFANIPNVNLIRSNWRVLFINASNRELRGKTQSDAAGPWKYFRMMRERGLLHVRTVVFTTLLDDDDDDADDNEDDAGGPLPPAAAAAAAAAAPVALAVPNVDPSEVVMRLIAAIPAEKIDGVIAKLNELKLN